MSREILESLVVLLLIAQAVHLALTLRLAKRLAPASAGEAPLSHAIGAPVEALSGRHVVSGTPFSWKPGARPTALVFLSPGCGECMQYVPRLVAMLPAIRRAGIEFFVDGIGRAAEVRRLVSDTPLRDVTVALPNRQRLRVNPRGASPFYLFVDEYGAAKASGFLGDATWRLFVEQMDEYAAAASGVPVASQ